MINALGYERFFISFLQENCHQSKKRMTIKSMETKLKNDYKTF